MLQLVRVTKTQDKLIDGDRTLSIIELSGCLRLIIIKRNLSLMLVFVHFMFAESEENENKGIEEIESRNEIVITARIDRCKIN